jgi:hypothetical protein
MKLPVFVKWEGIPHPKRGDILIFYFKHLNMKKIKNYLLFAATCICFLTCFLSSSAQAQYHLNYQYYEYNEGETWTGEFDFGDDPYYCPEYQVRPNQLIYLEPRSVSYGNSGYFSLYDGMPSSYFNYGGFGMLKLEVGQYALLKAEFSTPNGPVYKYIYLSCFQ